MSLQIGKLVHWHFSPELVAALLGVALIGSWRGRTFLDDDLDFSDIQSFVPSEDSLPLVLPGPAHPPEALTGSVAA